MEKGQEEVTSFCLIPIARGNKKKEEGKSFYDYLAGPMVTNHMAEGAKGETVKDSLSFCHLEVKGRGKKKRFGAPGSAETKLYLRP